MPFIGSHLINIQFAAAVCEVLQLRAEAAASRRAIIKQNIRIRQRDRGGGKLFFGPAQVERQRRRRNSLIISLSSQVRAAKGGE